MLLLATYNHLANYVNMLYSVLLARHLSGLLNGWIRWKIQGPMKRRIGLQKNNESRTLIVKSCQVDSAINIINNQL